VRVIQSSGFSSGILGIQETKERRLMSLTLLQIKAERDRQLLEQQAQQEERLATEMERIRLGRFPDQADNL
jgi:hypothetical protein